MAHMKKKIINIKISEIDFKISMKLSLIIIAIFKKIIQTRWKIKSKTH